MLVSELVSSYKAESGYVTNSLIEKSHDDYGVTYKWLFKRDDTIAYRREMFIAAEGAGDPMDRTVIMNIEVIPAE